MSYSKQSRSLIPTHTIVGHDDIDEDGNPTGGYARDFDCDRRGAKQGFGLSIVWQDGPLDRENDHANGAFVEDVLYACQMRLEHFQRSKFACEANATAIVKIEEAIGALEGRLADRQERGVLGKNEV